MSKKIIITGGLGYIGTELCKLYSGVSWHHKIIVFDNRFISERVTQIRNWNMDFIHGDILDKESHVFSSKLSSFWLKLIKKFVVFEISELSKFESIDWLKLNKNLKFSKFNKIFLPIISDDLDKNGTTKSG